MKCVPIIAQTLQTTPISPPRESVLVANALHQILSFFFFLPFKYHLGIFHDQSNSEPTGEGNFGKCTSRTVLHDNENSKRGGQVKGCN